VKNSRGVGPGGSSATVEDIRFMKQHLNGRAKTMASEGIRSNKQAVALLAQGWI
jgi:deoxyribose-phosphate aldolase